MNVILIHSDNSYQIDKVLSSYLAKYKSFKIQKVDGESAKTLNDLSLDFSTSLFSEEKVVLLHSLFKNKSKDLLERLKEYIEKDASNNTVIFLEYSSVDKRTSFYKLLKAKFKVEECEPLSSRDLIPWISLVAKEKGLKLSSSISYELLNKIGSDQSQIEKELSKLEVLGKSEITLDDISTYISSSKESEIFSLTEKVLDYIVKGTPKDLKEILRLTEYFKEDYKNYPIFLSIIVNQLSQLIRIKILEEAGYGSEQITKELKAHPFVIRKLFEKSKQIDLKTLETKYTKLSTLDQMFKVGKVDFLELVTLLLKK